MEGGFYDHAQSHGSDDGGLLLRLFRGTFGTRGSAVSGSGRSHCFFFWVGGNTVVSGMGREGVTVREVRVVFTS